MNHFQLIVSTRIAEHQAAEQARLDAERERIRQEEAAKLQREQLAKQAAVVLVEPESTMAAELAKPAQNTPNIPLIHGEIGVVDCAVRIVDKRARTSVPTLRIGTIKERLQHMTVTAEDLRALGFEPAGRERAAPLYHDDDFPAICDSIAARALAAKAQFLRDLAVVAA
jgi:hypothetical protein